MRQRGKREAGREGHTPSSALFMAAAHKTRVCDVFVAPFTGQQEFAGSRANEMQALSNHQTESLTRALRYPMGFCLLT